MQFGMRLLLACATLCVVRPADLQASVDLMPATVAFAYSARHGTGALSPEAMVALRSADQPDAGHNPPALAAYKSRTLSRSELCLAAVSVAQANDLPVPFFANLIQQESAFRPDVVSPAGAQGIAQFMPRVAAAYGLSNPFDPIHGLIVSGKFLRELVAQFGNLGLAAAAYNAGSKRVIDWMAKRGKLPSETRNYVQNITGKPAERWANRKALIEEIKLPTHARCPDMPVAMVRLPGVPQSVKVAAAPKARKSPDKKSAAVVSGQRKPRGKIVVIAKIETPSKLANSKKTNPRAPLKLAPVLAQAKLAKDRKPASRPAAKRVKLVASR